jgi:hypothetical protein
MTAPTSAVQTLQKILANVGPSTHDPSETNANLRMPSTALKPLQQVSGYAGRDHALQPSHEVPPASSLANREAGGALMPE